VCDVRAVRIAELCCRPKASRARARAAVPTTSASGVPPATRYVFRWNRLGRKGQTCRLIARGTMNSCLLEFDDGWRMVTSRNAIAKLKA
jgi:hypothetical protein